MSNNNSGNGGPGRPGERPADPGAAVETARRGLQIARDQLAELAKMLGRLSEVSGSLRPVIDRLSEMTLTTASEMNRAGDPGKPLVPMVTQLGAIAGLSAIALGELQGCLRHSLTAVQAVTTQAESSSAELDRILPVLESAGVKAAASATAVPPPIPQAAQAAEPVVALELKVASSSRGQNEGQQQKASVLDVWPAKRTERNDLN
jgi:hypothetical protein